jgi:hypothetical protein
VESLHSEIRFEKVVSFIREQTVEYERHIDAVTLIENDLGVTGDEAVELIKSFAKEFNVYISGFEYAKYFHPEPGFFTVAKTIEPLTVGDLYDSLGLKKLV